MHFGQRRVDILPHREHAEGTLAASGLALPAVEDPADGLASSSPLSDMAESHPTEEDLAKVGGRGADTANEYKVASDIPLEQPQPRLAPHSRSAATSSR